MHDMKVVDIVKRNSEQVSFNFSDFSTILKRIYKFADFQKKKKKEM